MAQIHPPLHFRPLHFKLAHSWKIFQVVKLYLLALQPDEGALCRTGLGLLD